MRWLLVVLIFAVAGFMGWNVIEGYVTPDTSELEMYSQLPDSSGTDRTGAEAGRQNRWEPVGGPGGGDLQTLEIALDDQGEKVFYEILGNGLFRYRAEEWKLITPSFEGQVFNDFAVLPVSFEKHVLYLATSDGLFSSADEGDHWTDLNSNAFGGRAWRIAVGREGETTRILVLSDEGLFQRVENGPWDKALLPPEAAPPFHDVSLIKEPDGSFTALVAAATGVFRSNSLRRNWESVSRFRGKVLYAFPKLNVSPGEAFAVTYEPRYYYWQYFFLYRTIDGGRTWSAMGDRRDFWSQGLVRALETDVVDALSSGDYALSKDTGKSWTHIRLENMESAQMVAISPTWYSDGRFYSASNTGQVLEIDTLKKGWRLASSKPPAACVRRVSVFHDRQGTQTLIAAGTNGFYVSEDEGGSWQAKVVGLNNHDVQAIAISPDFDKDNTILVGTGSGLYSMRWGDAAWQAAGKPMANLLVDSIAYSPMFASDRSVFAGTNRGIFRSTDSGQTWQAATNGLNGVSVNAVLPRMEAGHLRLYAATVQGLYSSDDRGDAWRIVNSVPQLNTLTLYAEEKQSRIWIGNTDGLFYWSPGTEGHGVRMGSWSKSVSSLLYTPSQSGLGGILIAGTIGGGAYCSSDGGERWIPMGSAIDHQQILDLTNSGGPNTVLFAGTANRGVLRYLGPPSECMVSSHP
jgi:photosystem II stability/assembly factor-like uncharacterized protein